MTAVSKAANKLKFETGDVPTQSDFADFIDSSENIVDENLFIGSETGIAAVSPADQSTATLLTKKVNRVDTVDSTGAGVLLPPALAGRFLYVVNNDSDNLYVFPGVGEQIRLLDTNIPIKLNINSNGFFYCAGNGTWEYVLGLQSGAQSFLTGVDVAVLPVTGGDQTTGYQIQKLQNQISSNPTASAACVLPNALAGRSLILINNVTLPALVYPQTGESIQAAATNAPTNIAFKEVLNFYCLVDGAWLLLRSNYGTDFGAITGTDTNITDVTPSSQGSAYVLTAAYNTINTAHSTAGGVKLPSAITGRIIYVTNNGGYDTQVWCGASNAFVQYGADGFVTLVDKSNGLFVCLNDGWWSYIPGFTETSTSKYKEYVATLSQTGTAAPVVTVKSNNLGNIVWTRDTTGEYTGTLTGAFTNPTWLMINNNNIGYQFAFVQNDNDSIVLITASVLGVEADSIISDADICIRVYND